MPPSRRSFVDVYTDGGCYPNPGHGGWCAILQYRESGTLYERTLSGSEIYTTNNRMELMGPIRALESLTRSCRVRITSDSQYVVHAFTESWMDKWKRMNFVGVRNSDMWQRLLLAMENHDVSWVWVRGHAGHEMNERCDAIASQEVKRSRELCCGGQVTPCR